jgi:hypothetical protein
MMKIPMRFELVLSNYIDSLWLSWLIDSWFVWIFFWDFDSVLWAIFNWIFILLLFHELVLHFLVLHMSLALLVSLLYKTSSKQYLNLTFCVQISVDHNDQRAEAIPCSTATPNWTVHVSDVSDFSFLDCT